MERIKMVMDLGSLTAEETTSIITTFIETILDEHEKRYGDLEVCTVELEIEEAPSGISSLTVIDVPKSWDKEKIEEFIDEIIDLIGEYVGDASK